MSAAIDRHLKYFDSKISTAKDREFVKCKQVLEGKARALPPKKHGKFMNIASISITHFTTLVACGTFLDF